MGLSGGVVSFITEKPFGSGHNVLDQAETCMLKLKQPDPDEVVEATNGLNAPLMHDLPASDETGFRPLTDEEKKDFVSSLDAKGRQTLADLEFTPQSCSSTTEDHKGGNQLG